MTRIFRPEEIRSDELVEALLVLLTEPEPIDSAPASLPAAPCFPAQPE